MKKNSVKQSEAICFVLGKENIYFFKELSDTRSQVDKIYTGGISSVTRYYRVCVDENCTLFFKGKCAFIVDKVLRKWYYYSRNSSELEEVGASILKLQRSTVPENWKDIFLKMYVI